MTDADVSALLEAVRGDRLEALYVLAAATGMRQGELLGLEWPALDLDKGEVHVRQSMSWADGQPVAVPPKTSRSRRTIPLFEESVVDAMRQHQKRTFAADPSRLEQGLVFTTEAGSPLVGWKVTREMQRHLREAGVDGHFGFHDFRRFVASKWANKGMAPRQLMGLLGHAQIATTFELYAHTTVADIRESMRRLA